MQIKRGPLRAKENHVEDSRQNPEERRSKQSQKRVKIDENCSEEEVLELKYQLEAMHSKLSALHNINKSLSHSKDEVRASLQVSFAEKRGLEKENLKLKRTSEDLRTSADNFKERIVSLQGINENLLKTRDDLKEEN